MDLAEYVQKEIDIRSAIKEILTIQRLILGDSRKMKVDDESVGLVLISFTYWNLKKYDPVENQLGLIKDYNSFYAN